MRANFKNFSLWHYRSFFVYMCNVWANLNVPVFPPLILIWVTNVDEGGIFLFFCFLFLLSFINRNNNKYIILFWGILPTYIIHLWRFIYVDLIDFSILYMTIQYGGSIYNIFFGTVLVHFLCSILHNAVFDKDLGLFQKDFEWGIVLELRIPINIICF